MSKEASALTINDLMQQEKFESIWALNTTHGTTRGNVFFTVPNATGTKEDHVTVLQTFVPVCLTDQVTREQLLGSSHFRRCINQRKLKIISDSDARVLLEEPGAAEEANRVNELAVGTASAEAQYGVGRDQNEVQVVDNNEGISLPVVQFIELMDSSSASEALSTYRNLGELSLVDCRRILRKAKELNYEALGKRVEADIAALKAKKNGE